MDHPQWGNRHSDRSIGMTSFDGSLESLCRRAGGKLALFEIAERLESLCPVGGLFNERLKTDYSVLNLLCKNQGVPPMGDFYSATYVRINRESLESKLMAGLIKVAPETPQFSRWMEKAHFKVRISSCPADELWGNPQPAASVVFRFNTEGGIHQGKFMTLDQELAEEAIIKPRALLLSEEIGITLLSIVLREIDRNREKQPGI